MRQHLPLREHYVLQRLFEVQLLAKLSSGRKQWWPADHHTREIQRGFKLSAC